MNPDELLKFWFDPHPSSPEAERYSYRPQWFVKSAHFDSEVLRLFKTAWDDGQKGLLSHWENTAEGILALVILYDQLPRNMFRDQAASFETDGRALHLARNSILKGVDLALPPIQRWFLYLPFEHSENLRDQEISVELFAHLQKLLPDTQVLDYAERHRDIIARFGRFPHRNNTLQRKSSAEELEFLKGPNSRF